MTFSRLRAARVTLRVLLALAACGLAACRYANYRETPAAGVDLARPTFVTVSVPPAAAGSASYDLLVGVTEVTQRMWRDVMGTSPSATRCDNCPVELVSWYDVATYANALSEREGLTPCYALSACTQVAPYRRGAPGNRFSHEVGLTCEAVAAVGPTCDGYRLPSRAEWNAYGGVAALTESDRHVRRYAVIHDNYRRSTRLVGSLLPNEHGLYDTLGNVEEWLDWPTSPPSRISSARRRVANPAWFLTAATCFRTPRHEANFEHFHSELGAWGNDCLGFRLVRTAPAQ
jgi:formylglycine-generating enzyme required for sulfatase activity